MEPLFSRLWLLLTLEKAPWEYASPSSLMGNLTSQEPTIFWILKSWQLQCGNLSKKGTSKDNSSKLTRRNLSVCVHKRERERESNDTLNLAAKPSFWIIRAYWEKNRFNFEWESCQNKSISRKNMQVLLYLSHISILHFSLWFHSSMKNNRMHLFVGEYYRIMFPTWWIWKGPPKIFLPKGICVSREIYKWISSCDILFTKRKIEKTRFSFRRKLLETILK